MANEIRQWNRKRIDIVIVMLYVLMSSLFVHVASSIHRRHFNETPVIEQLLNPFRYFTILFLTMIFASPFTFYYKKVPKNLIIDPLHRKMQIKKRRRSKPLNFDLDRITYHTESTKWFSILEFYSELTNSRGITIKKRFTSIVVPAFGFSWNKKTIHAIVDSLDELGIPVEENPQKRNIWDHIYN